MTQVTDLNAAVAKPDTDLVTELHRILQASAEPLTLSKIRGQLPGQFRGLSLEELAEVLHRQVAANVLRQYPRYRSQQDRFWDRPMDVHVAALLQTALQQGALPWSELRRKLPAYAQTQAETVLEEQVSQGRLHRHPRAGRAGERFGNHPPDPRDYLRPELEEVFRRLEQFGFSRTSIREGALELLHEEEWISPSPAPTEETSGMSASPQADTPADTGQGQTAPHQPSQPEAHAASQPVVANQDNPGAVTESL